MSRVESTLLRPGHAVSRVIRGGWQLAGDHGHVDRQTAINDMLAFVDAGINTFDCADIYTGVEEMIGDFLLELRNLRGSEVANTVTVHTKHVPDLARLGHWQRADTEAIIDRSLQRLKLEQLHLVQFFWWDLSQGEPLEALEALKSCQQKGKIANLGVTNWDSAPVNDFIANGHDIVSAQVQYSVLDRRPTHGMAAWAAEHELQFLCYGTLAGGFLTESWLGKTDPGFEFSNRSLVKYRLIIDEFGTWDLFQTLLQTLFDIGQKHSVSISAVASRWVLDQPQVAAVIVGARYATHLAETLDIFAFSLDDNDRARISEIHAQAKGPQGLVYALESDRTSRHGKIMKYNLNTRLDDQIAGADHG